MMAGWWLCWRTSVGWALAWQSRCQLNWLPCTRRKLSCWRAGKAMHPTRQGPRRSDREGPIWASDRRMHDWTSLRCGLPLKNTRPAAAHLRPLPAKRPKPRTATRQRTPPDETSRRSHDWPPSPRPPTRGPKTSFLAPLLRHHAPHTPASTPNNIATSNRTRAPLGRGARSQPFPAGGDAQPERCGRQGWAVACSHGEEQTPKDKGRDEVPSVGARGRRLRLAYISSWLPCGASSP